MNNQNITTVKILVKHRGSKYLFGVIGSDVANSKCKILINSVLPKPFLFPVYLIDGLVNSVVTLDVIDISDNNNRIYKPVKFIDRRHVPSSKMLFADSLPALNTPVLHDDGFYIKFTNYRKPFTYKTGEYRILGVASKNSKYYGKQVCRADFEYMTVPDYY